MSSNSHQYSSRKHSLKQTLAFDLSGTKEETLKASITPTESYINKNIIWRSSNTSVATVDEKGTVTAVGKGESTITATTINGKTASCQVTVIDSAPKEPDNPNNPNNPDNPDNPNIPNNPDNPNNSDKSNNQGNANNGSNQNTGNNSFTNGKGTTTNKGSVLGSKDYTLSNNKVLPKAGNYVLQIILLVSITILITFTIICYKKSKI